MSVQSLRRSKWDFAACAKYLAAGKNPTYCKLANNTYLHAVPSELPAYAQEPPSIAHYAIILHKTAVVRIYPDSSVRLFSGGWRTVTTKQRINAFSPIGVYQVNRTWRINPDTEFFEGIHISACGDVLPD